MSPALALFESVTNIEPNSGAVAVRFTFEFNKHPVFLRHPNIQSIDAFDATRVIDSIPGRPGFYYEKYIKIIHLLHLKKPVPTMLEGQVNYRILHDQDRKWMGDIK